MRLALSSSSSPSVEALAVAPLAAERIAEATGRAAGVEQLAAMIASEAQTRLCGPPAALPVQGVKALAGGALAALATVASPPLPVMAEEPSAAVAAESQDRVGQLQRGRRFHRGQEPCDVIADALIVQTDLADRGEAAAHADLDVLITVAMTGSHTSMSFL
jgi:hypothetical protein